MDLQNESREEMALDAQAGSEVPDIEIYYANHDKNAWSSGRILAIDVVLVLPYPQRSKPNYQCKSLEVLTSSLD
jgi:hypothetical protein